MINMLFLIISLLISSSVLLPVDYGDRKDISRVQLTEIGEFGLMRKARVGIPAHFHTGIDIKRPGNNYHDEPIFPIAPGRVISKRTDGPYAQLIIEHNVNGFFSGRFTSILQELRLALEITCHHESPLRVL